jgi:RNA polymerase sigma factor (sigma-70 family)
MTTESCGAEIARERELRLAALYAAHGRSVLAYAVRRAVDEHDAADVVAETFLVAWRRLDDVPLGDLALMWLYGVARRTLANQQRSERRRRRLAERLGRELVPALQAVAPSEPAAIPILAALAGLGPRDREIVLLAAWEELSPQQIGVVLGIGQIAVRSRLRRARKRLRALLDHPAEVDHVDQPSIQETV